MKVIHTLLISSTNLYKFSSKKYCSCDTRSWYEQIRAFTRQIRQRTWHWSQTWKDILDGDVKIKKDQQFYIFI